MQLIEKAATGQSEVLGHEVVGAGPTVVVVMNDWLCDTSTWDHARVYLDTTRLTWVFADLRGYGRSRGRAGEHTVMEAAADILALTSLLGVERFAVVGHSMSTLVALHLAQTCPARVERAVVITPPPPTGFGADEAMLEGSRSIARAGEDVQLAFWKSRSDGRLPAAWPAFKVGRWRATADAEAAAGYVAMFARDGLPDPVTKIAVPVLAITGEMDMPAMRSESVTRLLGPLCEQLVVAPLADCGHYPMQEAPPKTVSLVERFLTRAAPAES